jgi:hypothetical protein
MPVWRHGRWRARRRSDDDEFSGSAARAVAALRHGGGAGIIHCGAALRFGGVALAARTLAASAVHAPRGVRRFAAAATWQLRLVHATRHRRLRAAPSRPAWRGRRSARCTFVAALAARLLVAAARGRQLRLLSCHVALASHRRAQGAPFPPGCAVESAQAALCCARCAAAACRRRLRICRRSVAPQRSQRWQPPRPRPAARRWRGRGLPCSE